MKQFHLLLILLIFLSGVASSAIASPMDEALQAFQAGDLPEAINIWTSEATAGDSDAQYILGALHYDGTGVPQSDSEAMKWFQASAEQGYALAQNALANMYFSGKGIPTDYELAVKWWLLAAEKGMPDSQNNVAGAYRDGLGVEKDIEAAIMWFEKAAFQRDGEAMISLGGVYHEEGNSEMAYVWWYVAGMMGSEDARKNVEILDGRLTSDQIESAQASAKKILHRINP